MPGAIAAGSLKTAEIGAQILKEGGNAIDAAVAACFATGAGEPSLTSLAGGSCIVLKESKSNKVYSFNSFAKVPGLGLKKNPAKDFEGKNLCFGETKQTFYIGKASVAVTGLIPNLCQILHKWGTLPLQQILEPSIEALNKGVYLTTKQITAIKLLEPILRHSKKTSNLFIHNNKLIDTTTKYKNPMLAETLSQMYKRGWENYYKNEFIPILLKEFGPNEGGLITLDDIVNFSITETEALSYNYNDFSIYAPPVPAAGGELIQLTLSMLEKYNISLAKLDENSLKTYVHIMYAVDKTRLHFNNKPLGKGAESFCLSALKNSLENGLKSDLKNKPEPNATTHVSCIDSEGNSIAITFSYGEGCGYMLGDTGIIMNNLLGEEDLSPMGFHSHQPGADLRSMMSPTLLCKKVENSMH